MALPYTVPAGWGARLRPPGTSLPPPPPPSPPPPVNFDPAVFGPGPWPLGLPRAINWTEGRAAVLLPPNAADIEAAGNGVGVYRLALCFTAASGAPTGIRGLDSYLASLVPADPSVLAARLAATAVLGRRRLQQQEEQQQEEALVTGEASGVLIAGAVVVGGQRRLAAAEDAPPPEGEVVFSPPPPPRPPPPPSPPGQAVFIGNAVAAQLGAGGRRVLLLRQAGIESTCETSCAALGPRWSLGPSAAPGYLLQGTEYTAAWAVLLQQIPPRPDALAKGLVVGAWLGKAAATYVPRNPDVADGPAATSPCTGLRWGDGSLRSTPCESYGWCMCWSA